MVENPNNKDSVIIIAVAKVAENRNINHYPKNGLKWLELFQNFSVCVCNARVVFSLCCVLCYLYYLFCLFCEGRQRILGSVTTIIHTLN